MQAPTVVRLAEWRDRRRRERERLAQEAEKARREREASERLHRLLDGDWPPPGGHAA